MEIKIRITIEIRTLSKIPRRPAYPDESQLKLDVRP